MKYKYIVETISVFRNIHVVEAENQTEAYDIACVSDDNWQEHLGEMKVDIMEYTEDRIANFKDKAFFSEHVSFKDEDGCVGYINSEGEIIQDKTFKVYK